MSLDFLKNGKLQRVFHYEAELLVPLDNNNSYQLTKQYCVLDGTSLKCYTCREQWTNPNKTINLAQFHSISNTKKTKYFHLKSKNGKLSIKLAAISQKDKYEWIKKIRKVLADSYGTTVKIDNQVESICSIWFLISCIAMIALFAIGAALHKDTLLYIFRIVLSEYLMVVLVLCSYYFCQFKWVNIKQVIKFNKFWIEKLFCFLYNLVSFLLLTINISIHNKNPWYFTHVAVYFFGAFSIPFPAICIKLHHTLKYSEKSSILISPINDSTSTISMKNWLQNVVQLPQYYEIFEKENINDMATVRTLTNEDFKEMGIKIGDRKRILQHSKNCTGMLHAQSHRSTVSALFASQSIFRDNISKGVICACYMVHLLAYIGHPLLNHDTYVELNEITYYKYNEGNIFSQVMFNINQIFLRTFVGMTLTSVLFSFVTELIDNQITSTNYRVLYDIWNDQFNKYWIIAVILSVMMVPFEIFLIRDLINNKINVDVIINIIWIVINLSAAVMNVKFTMLFGGTYLKTKYEYNTLHQASVSPTSPIRAFVLEAVTLLLLYLVYIVFMILFFIHCVQANELNGDSDAKGWDTFRQVSILISSILQFLTLIKVKQTQKFGGIYLERFAKRPKLIVHGYYKWNCMLIMYNVLYIFIFKIEYFGSYFGNRVNDSDHLYQNIAYAFSFSVSSSMLFLLSHFIASYHQFQVDRCTSDAYENNGYVLYGADDDVLMAGLSGKRHSNDNLNKFMQQNRKKQDSVLLQQCSIESNRTYLLNAESISLDDPCILKSANGSKSAPTYTKQNKSFDSNQ